MARTYAAVMALLAMLVVLLRAMKDHAGFDGTITTALLWMAIFGAIGFVLGSIAQSTVDESVVQNLQANQQPATEKQKPPASTTAT